MRLFVASVIGLAFAVPVSAQQLSPQQAWVSIDGPAQAVGMSSGNGGFSVVPLADGRALAAGGSDVDGTPRAGAALFDGIRSWTPTTPMRSPRFAGAMTGLKDGTVMAVGASPRPTSLAPVPLRNLVSRFSIH